MTGNQLPDDGHVVRYVKPSLVDGEVIDGGAFVLREDETGLSVNWLEYFGGNNERRQVDEVRNLFRLRLSRNGRFARLNIGDTKEHVSAGAAEAGIVLKLAMSKAPLAATVQFASDPSHAEITGLPPTESDEAMLVGDLIADCVKHPLFPGRVG